jgi:hypothetical protein
MMVDPEPPGFIRGRDNPLATVGMFERSEWGGGFYATFASGEVVRVRRPIPSIVVQSLGRPLPPFATASLFIDHEPDFELDLVYEAPWLDVPAAPCPARFWHVKPRQRLILCDASLVLRLSQPDALPPRDFLIAAKAEALPVVAEALSILATGNVLIGCDLAQVLTLGEGGQTIVGRAITSLAASDAALAIDLGAGLAEATQDGFGKSLLLMQLATSQEAERVTLGKFVAFAEATLADAGDLPALFTASLDASVDAIVLIAFEHRFV